MRLLAEQFGVRRTIGLNAIPMAIPHTRPLAVTAHSTNKDLIAGHHRWSGELQVPAGVSSLLEYRMGQHGHESVASPCTCRTISPRPTIRLPPRRC